MDFSWIEKYFSVSPKGIKNPVVSIPADQLLDTGRMGELLQVTGDCLKATSAKLTATFVGLAAFGLCAAQQIAAAQQDRILDLSLENLTFQLENKGYPNATFKITEVRWTDISGESRSELLLEALTEFYRNTMRPFIETTAAVAQVKPDLIWNQFGARMAAVRDFITEQQPGTEMEAKFVEDYRLLMEQLPVEVLGRKKNPFDHKPRYIDNPYSPGSKMIVRSSCCYYDLREDGQRCYNCPHHTEEDRAKIRAKIQMQ